MSEPHWRMTQSLRVATFSHLNKLGEDVLVETDLKTKLCRHGETSSTIRNWLQFEAKARAECQTPLPRISTCDCTHTLGLQNNTLTRPPAPPSYVFCVNSWRIRMRRGILEVFCGILALSHRIWCSRYEFARILVCSCAFCRIRSFSRNV